ncbi:signal peptidase II [Spirulina sp. CS-785/01]|uniref:signal peptidase II n=1 Tax=Spirulina sp. CS-785/01 TaxID=3021716 RepID=UPI00232FDE2B|nr:signal peptidase II [Spirulina sp. CS-785/01]MDB9314414.1 signal peptidase II [Spirulina sp. CS-785/01]
MNFRVSPFQQNRYFWLAAALGLLLDQLSKYWVTHTFSEIGDTLPIFSEIFHFTYVINTGAAFSLFSGGVEWLRWLSLLVSIGLILFVWLSPKLSLPEQLGYGCILAGAIGNGVCRFINSHVIDFLDFRLIQFPVFNLADVFINIGIVLLLYAAFFPVQGKTE